MPLLTHQGWQRVVLACGVSALDQVLNGLHSDSQVVVEHVYDY
jgi:hypothetical protein